MIPAATTPQVPQLPCIAAAPCWIPGTGFRRIEDAGTACALIDAPLQGKMPIYHGTDHIHPLRSLFLAWDSSAEAGTASPLTPAPTPVPLPGAGGLLAVALITVLVARALLKFVAVDEALRGPDSGRP